MTIGFVTITDPASFKEEYFLQLIGELADSKEEYLQKYAQSVTTDYRETIKELRTDLPLYTPEIQEDILFAFSKALCECIEMMVSGHMGEDIGGDTHRHGPKKYDQYELDEEGRQPLIALVDYHEPDLLVQVETTIEQLLFDSEIGKLIHSVKQQVDEQVKSL